MKGFLIMRNVNSVNYVNSVNSVNGVNSVSSILCGATSTFDGIYCNQVLSLVNLQIGCKNDKIFCLKFVWMKS